MEETDLIKACIDGDRKAQYELYSLYSPKMYSVCMRYANNADDAQDLLQEGFIKVFKNLSTFRGEGSFEGWIRRIFIYTSIEYIRKKVYPVTNDMENVMIADKDLNGHDRLEMQDLLKIIQELPTGYKAVVNLYLVDGYSHKEIAEMLNINEGTSKSQLARAKAILQKKIHSLEMPLK